MVRTRFFVFAAVISGLALGILIFLVEAAYNAGILPACLETPLSFCPEDKLDRAWTAYMMVQAKDIPIP